MPLWEIFSPENAFTDEEKKQLAEAITQSCVDFVDIPRFYVVVRFHEMPANTMYVGGEATTNFIRVVVDTIARQMETAEIRAACMASTEQMLAPFVKERGFDWEIHFDETPMDLWRVQGIIPPPAYSDMEKLWAKENRPIPYEVSAP
ncbi:tautomerase family protein [Pseudonocardia eucalypti]|uniref:Tautomerase family protein n=1 Tax=Pseudonocardia eucalypti TaxID=648755 RepID=A0ABP9QWZ3_9PSEU|nr:4-oxalocrotonate tautomerase family enzyme [Pseudonocardia eucalypti]